ncbi:hypothetical protein BGW38_005185, partial [Lunasporangiospora selenospora]
ILAGFNNVPGGDGSKTVHSYHYYKPPQLGSIEDTLKNRVKDATRLKTGGMLTEFEFWGTSDATLAGILETQRQCDRYKQSWQGWAYENLWNREKGEPIPQLARLYARSYAEATAGEPTELYFQDSTAKYWVTWKADRAVTAPGLIRIAPQYYYPDGVRVFFKPEGAGTHTMENSNTVQLHFSDSVKTGDVVQASVQPFFPTDIIKNGASGMCLDNSDYAVAPGNPIVLWKCTSEANQVWKFKNGSISLAFDPSKNWDTFCLDTRPIAGKNYEDLVLNPCQAGLKTQQWSVTPTGNLKNGDSGKCVDITGSQFKKKKEERKRDDKKTRVIKYAPLEKRYI